MVGFDVQRGVFRPSVAVGRSLTGRVDLRGLSALAESVSWTDRGDMDRVNDHTTTSIRQEHDPAAVAARLATATTSNLSDWVLGAIDGAVTTFAIAAGAIGASLSGGTVVVLGVANLIADGISMAASRYAGARSDLERRQQAERNEYRHIELVPEGEREEVRQLLAAKGFTGADLDRAVDVITSEEDRWVDFMLVEELGFAPHADNPLRAAAATLVGFLVCGLLPIAPFVMDAAFLDVSRPELWSVALTASAFGAVGALRGHVVGLPRLRASLQTLAIGGIAAAAAFAVGTLLRDLV